MPITVEYQPDLVAAGQLAYGAGRGEYDLQQQQLSQRARQFDQTMAVAARRDAMAYDQFRTETGMHQMGMMLNAQAQREQALAELERQRMVQQGYAYNAQMEYEQARMREEYENKRQQEAYSNTRAMEAAKSAEAWIRKNNPTAEQVQQINEQFYQTYGYDIGIFGDEQVYRTMQAADETAKANAAKGLIAGFSASGMDFSPDEVNSWLVRNPETGEYTIGPTGQAIITARDRELSRKGDLELEDKRGANMLALERERQKGAGLEAEAKGRAEQAKQEQKGAEALTNAVDQAISSSSQALAGFESEFQNNATIDQQIKDAYAQAAELNQSVTGEKAEVNRKNAENKAKELEAKKKPVNFLAGNFPVISEGGKADPAQVIERLPINTYFRVVAPDWHPQAGELILMKRVNPLDHGGMRVVQVDAQGKPIPNWDAARRARELASRQVPLQPMETETMGASIAPQSASPNMW